MMKSFAFTHVLFSAGVNGSCPARTFLRSTLPAVLTAVVTVMLVSCGVDGKHFKLSGRLLNMNQGEFYIYSETGTIDGIDTIKVQGGRFTYETECTQPSTLMMVFPNFSEIPIFAQPGKSVELKGDASSLKLMKVKGTKENELMSAFREQIAHATPPEVKRYASQFVADHPDSKVAEYIVKHFFIVTPNPDYKEAQRLISLMLANKKENGGALRLQREVQAVNKSSVGSRLSTAGLTDMNGRPIPQSAVSSGDVAVFTWASWSFDSTNLLRQMRDLRRRSGGRLKFITVCLDASRVDCDNYVRGDSITWPNIFDGKMFEGRAVKQWSLYNVPTILLLRNGRVVARDITIDELERRLGLS